LIISPEFFNYAGFLKLRPDVPGIVLPPTLGSDAGTAGLFMATGGAVGGVAS